MSDHLEDDRYFKLADKWASGDISPEEMQQYADWYNKIDIGYTLEVPADHASSASEHKELILDSLRSRMANEPAGRKSGSRRKKIVFGWAVAASVILCIGSAIYFGLNNTAGLKTAHLDAPVGERPKILLTMSDGRQVGLDTLSEGSQMDDGQSKLVNKQGLLSYYAKDKAAKAADVSYNSMTTMRGSTYKLQLPDGTDVWLNAASSITYPTRFTTQERVVQLKGEAYFEVSKDKAHPFKVKTAAATIKVLGTHFDVMAYEEEKVVRTTLLEGSVQVTGKHGQVNISPGEAATVDPASAQIVIDPVNVSQSVAWVKGKLSLDDLDVASLMRQVSRWYDVDVKFEGQIPDVRFWGVLNSNASLADVLEVLKANGVKAHQTGKTVTVSSE